MQDFGTKTDNSPPPGGQLSAAEFNNYINELENAVTRSGQSLNGASIVQLAASLFLHSVKSQSFQDSGVANAYVATPVSGINGVLLPSDYANMDGAEIEFSASNASSGNTTLNIGQTTGTLLGTKKVLTISGAELPSGAIPSGAHIRVKYDASLDGGTGAWVLLPWSAFTSQMLPLGYFSGFTLSNNGGAPNTTVDTGPGTARSSDNTVDITLTGTISGILQSSGAWAAGTGQNKLDAGAKAINSTYHEFVIGHPTLDDDVIYSLSATAPALPSGYAGFRRAGRIVTDGSGNIRAFKDRGDGCFDWVTPSVEATLATTAPGTSLLTLSGMAGGQATARLQAACLGDSVAIKVIPSDVTDSATSTGPTTWTGGAIAQAGGASGNESASGESQVRVDTSGQVRVRTYTAAGNLDYRIIVFGWKESR
jgi:hypothetical protein